MKFIVFTALLALAAARPDEPAPQYAAPSISSEEASSEEVYVVRDDRIYPSAAGEYSLDLETSDGTVISESGYGSGPNGAWSLREPSSSATPTETSSNSDTSLTPPEDTSQSP